MRELSLLDRYLSIRSPWEDCFRDLDIAIVSIELTLEELSMSGQSLQEESDTTQMVHDKKPKLRTAMWEYIPPGSMRIMEGIMEGREHLASDEHSLLVGSIHCDFEDHCIHRGYFIENPRKSQLHFCIFFL